MQCSESESAANEQHQLFMSRLLSWPVVATTVDQVSALYVSTKERNRLLKLTMETAESGFGVAVHTAAPVVSRFEKQINLLNDIACDQLDKVENRLPIVKKPTDEVVKATKDMCNSAVKPIVDGVQSAKQYGRDKVTGVRDYAGGKITDIKNYGMNKVEAVTKLGSEQMGKVMGTAVPHALVHRLDEVLDVADRCVDSYLPEEEEGDVSKGDEKSEGKDDAENSVVVVSRAFHLGNKVRRRMYSRAVKQLHNIQLRSAETLKQLNFTVDLIEYARDNFNGAKDKAHFIWEEINKTEDEVAADMTKESTTITSETSTFERKAIATARQLTMKLKKSVAWIHLPQVNVGTVPEMTRERIQNLQKMVASLTNIFAKETTDAVGLSKSALDNARHLATQIYDNLFNLVSGLPGFNMLQKGQKVSESETSSSDDKYSSPTSENSKEEEVEEEDEPEPQNAHGEARDEAQNENQDEAQDNA